MGIWEDFSQEGHAQEQWLRNIRRADYDERYNLLALLTEVIATRNTTLSVRGEGLLLPVAQSEALQADGEPQRTTTAGGGAINLGRD